MQIAVQVLIERSPNSGIWDFVGEYVQQVDVDKKVTFDLSRKLRAYLKKNPPSFFDQAVTAAPDICRRYKLRYGEKSPTSEELVQTIYQATGSAAYIDLLEDITTGDLIRLVAESTDITTLDAQVKIDETSPVDLDGWVQEHDRSSLYWTAGADYTDENLQVPSGISIRLYKNAIDWSAYTTEGEHAVLLGGLSFEAVGKPVGPPENAINDFVVTSGLSAISSDFTPDAGFHNEVWRSSNATTGFTLLKVLDPGVTDINDTTAVPGTIYYYKVRPIKGTVTGLFSNVDSGQIYDALKITVKTDNPGASNNDQFTIPLKNVGNNVDVYNDDTGVLLASGLTEASSTITFAAGAGTYNLAIVGTLVGFGFSFSSTDERKITKLTNIGIANGKFADQGFYDCREMVWLDTVPLIINFGRRLFSTCLSMTSNQSLENADTSNLTNAAELLVQLPFNADIASWDVGNISSASNMMNSSSINRNLGAWEWGIIINGVTNGLYRIFRNSAMSTDNYTDTLVGWANNIFNRGGIVINVDMQQQSGMTFDTTRSGGANFANAGAARTYLTSTLGWTISGDTVI